MIKRIQDRLKGMAGIYMQIAESLRTDDPERSFTTFLMADTCEKAAEKMERMIPAQVEMEGGGSTWWYVCEECHTSVSPLDKYCRQCGRPLKWDEKISDNTQD